MAFEFRLPDIGEGLEDAEIVSWYVSPGDVVERDQSLLEVLTDKASSELPSPVAGKVLKLSGQEGDRIKVGDVLIEIEEPLTTPPQEKSLEEDSEIEESKPERDNSRIEEQKNFITVAPKVKASPATRKLARELTV
ncbi:MAG TPA: biotin/lipoyl-containing protein, partial [Acidimicrobiales bacterium]|nr:biotin/lipoyl-containing protein [Acidimicrobiales bacterium]